MKESNKDNSIKDSSDNEQLNECGLRFIKGIEIKESLTNFSRFGVMSVVKTIAILFYLGIVPILIKAISFGKVVYLSNTYDQRYSYIKNGQEWSSIRQVNNLPLGIFTGILYFVFGVIIWKIVCELLIIIFRCFETYVEKNKKDKN